MYMNDVDYGRMLAYLSEGLSVADVAAKLKCSHRTIRYWQTKSPPSTPRKWTRKEPPVVAKRRAWVRKLIGQFRMHEAVDYTPVRRTKKVRLIKQFLFPSPAKIARELRLRGIVASTTTVRRDLLAMSYRAVALRRGPNLTAEHKRLRVEFCRAVLKADLDIIFSDEKQIDSNQDQQEYQWITRRQIPETRLHQQGAPSLTLWGAIGKDFRLLQVLPRTVLNGEVYRTKVLQVNCAKLREVQKRNETCCLMQDNARPHCGSEDFLKRRRVRVLPLKWPALSPDLNPIEQLWSIIAKRVQARGPWGVDQLRQFVEEEWASVPQSTINKLVESFKSRCKSVVRAEGRTIKP